MNVTEDQLIAWLTAFIWPFFRVGSMFITIPIFSVKAVPAPVRLYTALLITVVLIPVLPAMPEIELFSSQGLMVSLQQILIGLLAGFILQMVFSVMLMAGQTIAYSMGLGFASLVDPATGIQVPVVAQIFVISGSLLFLGINGHLLLIEILAESFSTLPVAMIGLDIDDLWRVILWSSQIFIGGVLLALPVMAIILFLNISFGVASRAAPQLQIFGVGFPITILGGMVLIWMSITDMLAVFGEFLHQSYSLLNDLLRI